MPLSSGTRLGSYEITHVLGAGGMGEVYRARDTRLGRSVAIKIILEALGADPDRVARFEREAKVLASITHQNIAALYGMEESNGQHFLIMELVEGETLAERLQRGPLQVEEALRIAVQIAEALEAAHEKSIIHRDLKPANVKITPDDKVKVLDFGLAKTMEAEPARNVANSPTLSMMATNAGIILGTAAYMSPEQAKGFAADHRSDVFSFGVVLYEMLTGRQPFQGETAPDVLASVLIREPELQRLPADLNPRIPDLVRRCLEKSPKRRWQAIGDLRAEIEAVMAAPRAAPSPVLAAAPTKPLWRRAVPVVTASLATGLLAALAVWQLKPAPKQEITRFAVVMPDDQALTGLAGKTLDLSPDGRNLVYTAGGRLYVRPLSSMIATALQGTETSRNAAGPAFSPDGQQVVFHDEEGNVKRIAVGGGGAVPICSLGARPFWLSWAGDHIFMSTADGVQRVSADGGTPETIVSRGQDEMFRRLQVLPDGDTLLLTSTPAADTPDRWTGTHIVALSLKTNVRKVLVKGASDGWYVPSGHLLYMIGGGLYSVRFDLERLEPTGQVVQVIEGVRRANVMLGGVAWFSVSPSGTLAYMPGPPGPASTDFDVVVVDRNENATPMKLPPGPYRHPRSSPDGNSIAVESDDGRESVVRIFDRRRGGAPSRLTYVGRNRYPIWAADGKRVVFQSDRQGGPGIFWQPSDVSADAERLTTAAAGEEHIPESWHPRDDLLLFSVVKGGEYVLRAYSVRDRKEIPFGDVRSKIPTDAVFSPDGKWVAYTCCTFSDGTIYVKPYPLTPATYELPRRASGAPHHPLWLPGMTALVFNQRAGFVHQIGITTSPTFAFGDAVYTPRKFQTGPPNLRRQFDVLPDGSLIGLAEPGIADPSTSFRQFIVVMNWFDELNARVPGR
jgi:eukaryotic-like serine/threonine-protein kinase